LYVDKYQKITKLNHSG